MSAPIEVPVHLKAGLTVAEAAAMCGESESSIRRLVRDGVLARAPHTGRVIIARAELDRWLTSGRTELASSSPATGAVVAATAWAEQPLSLVGTRR